MLADARTCLDKQDVFHKKIKEWESTHGISSQEVEVPHYLRNLGWMGTHLDHNKGFNPLPICHGLLEHWIASKAVPHRSANQLTSWKADLEAVMQGERYPEVPTHNHDTLEQHGPSHGQQSLMALPDGNC